MIFNYHEAICEQNFTQDANALSSHVTVIKFDTHTLTHTRFKQKVGTNFSTFAGLTDSSWKKQQNKKCTQNRDRKWKYSPPSASPLAPTSTGKSLNYFSDRKLCLAWDNIHFWWHFSVRLCVCVCETTGSHCWKLSHLCRTCVLVCVSEKS